MLPAPASIAAGWHGPSLYAVGAVAAGVALLAAVLALTHQRERAFSASVVYLGLGALAAPVIALLGVGWYDPVADAAVGERLTELAVIVALFAAGMRLDSPLRGRAWAAPARLLLVVMPFTIAAVALFAWGVMGLPVAAAVILGAALAPTDPVLAGDLGVGPPGEEREDEASVAITAEAGMNDGLAFPFVYLGLFLAAGEGGWFAEWVAADVLWPIAAGLAIGGLAGWGLAWCLTRLRDRTLVSASLDGWAAIAVVLLVYGAAELAGGYGFLAAFAGGIGFRRYERDHDLNQGAHGGAEVVEKVGELAVILLLGSSLTLGGLATPGWSGWLLVPLLLVVVRPVATALALPRRWDWRARLWIGWFGVRGVGSLYYVSAVAATGVLSGGDAAVVVWTVIACVLVSIVVHGVTGTAATRALVVRRRGGKDVREPPVRRLRPRAPDRGPRAGPRRPRDRPTAG
jgi:NhaP-type Na+/H+ or K+/H+ antiporter